MFVYSSYLFHFYVSDLPCYLASHYNASSNVAKIIWILVIIVISIAIILAAYLIYRRREKKKIATGIYLKIYR